MQMTSEQDIVLIYFEDTPTVFARIESIDADHKKGWYHVKLLMLQIPLQTITWILRDRYIDGDEFTMNGKRIRLERIVCPESDAPEALPETNTDTEEQPPEPDASNVISFSDLKK